ncbi:hypothetical protein SAMN05444162_4595 [Paenibacillaceae bacterium GAS479]|nr:hypothetical protein SAMN05444162_4595 [Paenibacillaceae bacterium GAS479]
MKLFKVLLLLIVSLTAGCSTPSKGEVLDYLSSDSNNRYLIHLFYEGSPGQLDDELNVFWNSNKEYLEIIQGIQLYDVDVESNQDKAEAIGIENFPCFIVMNDEKIVLKTTELSEVQAFFAQLIP